MKWPVFIALASALSALPVAAASKTNAPAALFSTSTVNPVEADFQRVMALDDAAHEEIDKWIKDNGAFAKKGAGLSDAVLSLKIEQRLEPVKQAYEDFLQRNPTHARGQLAFGSFLNDLGEETEARKRWEKAIELDPTNPAGFNNLANSYGQSGPVAKAFELYAKAMELNPKQSIYYHNLGAVIVLHRKEAAEHYRISEQQVLRHALELYRLAEKFDPANFQLATDIAQVYYALQPPDHPAAIAAWTRALALARDDLEREGTHLHLARVMVAAGKLTEARVHLGAVTNASLAAIKNRLAGELADKALPVPTKEEPRRSVLPGAPK
ncbi:MAG: tetratricopeptide repeat protein [Proteobacteria bacterium]|nr:tetratricopeptide repeat protein [Verrucomicrobiota bacterium]NBU07885.1 tetratricopeptide repeat protein [Pseudomonadota bacterium]